MKVEVLIFSTALGVATEYNGRWFMADSEEELQAELLADVQSTLAEAS